MPPHFIVHIQMTDENGNKIEGRVANSVCGLPELLDGSVVRTMTDMLLNWSKYIPDDPPPLKPE